MSLGRIRVLIVDDSAFARKVMREVLLRDLDLEVIGFARDGLEALEKVVELKPDVMTLDLVMPDLDGLGVLKALQKLDSPPRVVIVSVSGFETDLAIAALQLGAVDLVMKPTPLPTDRLYELSAELISKVKGAAAAKPFTPFVGEGLAPKELSPKLRAQLTTTRLVVIGTSTGGPQALSQLFKMLPAGLPVPIAVALHIPAGYTAPLAARISAGSAIQMVEAVHGMELVAGHAVIAPGGMHLRIIADKRRFFAAVSAEPLQTLYHPSVNILFESAALSAGDGALAVILTGMGNDGMEGATFIKAAGGRVLAESASSCVVYGMPRSVIDAGLNSAEAPLTDMPKLIVDSIYGNPIFSKI